MLMKWILIIAALAYLFAAAGMYYFQRDFIYPRDSTRTDPASAGLSNVVERILHTPDGQQIVAWYGKAKPGQPTLLYFHGNGGALEIRCERIAKYMQLGRGIFMMAYRGYSGSTGSPNEKDIIADANLAYETLLADGIAPQDIIVYGESLGTAVAVQVAAANPVRGLILDSPFTSLLSRARLSYPWLPVSFLLHDRYMSSDVIKKVQAPLLIVHGEADEVVPVAMGRELFALANDPKELVTLAGAGHNDHWQFGSYDAINAWIDRLWRREVG